MKKLSELSVFFPLYNEEKNVEHLVEQSLEVFPKYAKKYEILLINDGSTDKTKEKAEKLAKKHKYVKVISQTNKGYGGALKTGFKNAKYKWIFYSDGDLQFDLNEIKNFIPHTKKHDLVIGYRKKRAEGFKRVLITKLLKLWNSFFFDFPLYIKDIDCAFKLIKKRSLKKLGGLSTNGGLISTEMLLKAKRENLNIKQVPVSHYKRKHGSSTGDSTKVISKAIKETALLLNVFPQRKAFLATTLFWLLVLLVLIPVSLTINYMQNDEYTHYKVIRNFLDGNFVLDSYLGATFYVQGLMAAAFSLLLGTRYIPVLTLILSVVGIYIFNLILLRFYRLKPGTCLLVSLLVFLNPWYLYSSMGFMSENYFMFFFMISLYFIYKFGKKQSDRHFWLANIFIWLSYGVRQFGLVTSAAFTFALLTQKKFKHTALQFLNTTALLIFHYFIFPKTPQMYDERLMLGNLLDIDYVHTIVYIIGTYLGLFLLPLLVSSIKQRKYVNKKIWLTLILIPLLFFYMEKKFEPEEVVFTLRNRDGTMTKENISKEFPYLKNVFTRKGFYEDNLPGDKYGYPGYFDLFKTFEIFGKLTFLFLLIYGILNIKRIDDFPAWFLVCFTGMLLLSPRIFDRYLLPMIIPAILLTISLVKLKKTSNFILAGAVAFWLFLGYQFTADFITTNRYIWLEANELHRLTQLPKNKISADHSWQQLYPNPSKKRVYIFTYADFGKAQRSENYELISTKHIDFPFNFYKEPNIYLYKNWGALEY